MSNVFKKGFLQSYKETKVFRPFLSSWFTTTPRDIIQAESVVIDVKRGGRKIAPVISNIAQNAGRLEKSQYTQKDFKPPVIALGTDCSATDLIEKEFGKTEYDVMSPASFMIAEKFREDFQEIEAEIMQALEYQASQILQTGVVNLYDENGNIAYNIDYKMKATHNPFVSIAWGTPATATPDKDMYALIRKVSQDGKAQIKHIVFGETALENYLKAADTKSRFDMMRFNSGLFNPSEVNPDADYLGDILVGTKRVAAWSYQGQYDNPASPGNYVDYVGTNNVIMLPEKGGINVDFRLVWCLVPSVTGIDPRFAGLIPSSMNLGDRQYTPRVYADNNADAIIAELKCRPLCIPVSIDSFACLKTTVS